MAHTWTDAQLDAIEARGGTILVSAAAGSGKTAVLVERVIRRITDEADPMDVSRLLVVTFTRAAAAEMKSRIAARLSALLLERPEDIRLQRQQVLLPGAQISTIDAFCSRLVREHFGKLGIAPSFRVAEGKEYELLKNAAAEEAIEEHYRAHEAGSPFYRLTDLLTSGKNDDALAEQLIALYHFIQTHPFPDAWLTQKLEAFETAAEPLDTAWGAILAHYAQDAACHCISLCEEALAKAQEDDEFAQKYAPAFAGDLAFAEKLKFASAQSWDGLYHTLRGYDAVPLASVRGRGEEPLSIQLKALRAAVKKQIASLQKMISGDSRDFQEDIAEHRALCGALFDLVRTFTEKYTARKREKGALDFSDLTHLTIRLLAGEDGSRTPLAREIAQGFDEIMIDEYQDTNDAQDMIFRALSNEERNLFMVGDVKQSIYGFRGAAPGLFLARCEQYPLYDRAAPRFPARITLDRNFRSRSGVTGAVNFVFRQLMTAESGGLSYKGGEELVPGAQQYPGSEAPCAEFHIIDTSDFEGEDERRTLEARRIGRRIRQLMEEKTTVTVDGETRPLRYRDICILLRKGKSVTAQYVRELERQGIPAWAEETGGFFETAEVSTVLSLIQVIDNPNQDIPLLSVMLSPLFGFTAEEVAGLRAAHPRGRLYYAVQAGREESGHVRAFLEELALFRTLSATLPADRLIAQLYDRTGFTAVVQAMKNGELRLSNLRLVLEYARDYEQTGGQGLSGFVRFLDRLREKGIELAQASALSEAADVVRVITMHKSKGLEFPVCILADTVVGLQSKNGSRNVLLHRSLGPGMKCQEREGLVTYKTLPYEAVDLGLALEQADEELRLLYVAMTRARERLIVTAAMKNPAKTLSELSQSCGGEETMPGFAVRQGGCMADWVLSCVLRHPSGEALRMLAGAGGAGVLPSEGAWRVEIQPACEAAEDDGEEVRLAPSAPAHREEVKEILSFVYPRQELSRIPAKTTATELAHEEEGEKWKYRARPHFERRKALTPTERGIAVHKYMQFADYARAAANPEGERTRLVEGRFLSAEESAAVSMDAIRGFFSSPLGIRILNAPRCRPEMRFLSSIDARSVVPDVAEAYAHEQVVLNGVVDCVLEEEDGLVVIDYKTDRTDSMETLADRYRIQLEIYARAMEDCLGKPVREKVIYSFHLGESVSL